MKRLFLILCVISFAVCGCVGVHEDDDIIPVPVIDPEDGSVDIGTRFFHRSLAFDFTASWCQYCPKMAATLASAKLARPGRIIDIAIHQFDTMEAGESGELVERFKASSFPVVVFDLDASTWMQSPSEQSMLEHVDWIVPLAASGIAIDASSQDSLRIKVKAAIEGIYRIAVAVVEDGIVEEQAGYGPGYVNNSVLRSFLGGVDGNDLGSLKAGQEARLAFPAASGKDCRIVAYILKQDAGGAWRVDNVAQCAVGKIIEYRYEQD